MRRLSSGSSLIACGPLRSKPSGLCDRGFHRVEWLKRLLELKQHFVVRLQREGLRCENYFQARNFIEYLLLSGDPEQRGDKLRLSLSIIAC